MALTPTQEAQVLELINQQAALLSLANNEATITSKLAATKVNLSQLSPATTLADNDLMLVRQGVVDKSATGATVKALAQTGAVLTTGDQSIAGTKTFSSTIAGSITGNAGSVTNGVYTTGDQSIAGTKTFSTAPVAPIADDTTASIARVATQAEVNAGTGTNTIVTPARMRLGFAISLTANGYIAFPTWMGGLIIQWGVTPAISAVSSFTQNLSISYPSSNVFVGITGNAGGASQSQSTVTSRANSNFVIGNNASVSCVYNYLSVGY